MSYLLLVAAMAAGVLPHLGGLSPAFGGMLYGGARLRRRDALWLPPLLMAALYAVQARFVYHSALGWGLLWTTVAMIPMVLAGELLRPLPGAGPGVAAPRHPLDARPGWGPREPQPGLRVRRSWRRLGAACAVGATGFFALSNFAVWASGVMYPHTLAGLGVCYLAGLPFYGDSLAAAALFGGFLFAADAYLARRRVPAPVPVRL